MSVKLTTRQVGDVTVVDAVGRITLGDGASLFRDTIRDLAANGQKKLLLNLAEVSYIDSSGIGEMVSGFTTVTNQGGQSSTFKGGFSYYAKDASTKPAPTLATINPNTGPVEGGTRMSGRSRAEIHTLAWWWTRDLASCARSSQRPVPI